MRIPRCRERRSREVTRARSAPVTVLSRRLDLQAGGVRGRYYAVGVPQGRPGLFIASPCATAVGTDLGGCGRQDRVLRPEAAILLGQWLETGHCRLAGRMAPVTNDQAKAFVPLH